MLLILFYNTYPSKEYALKAFDIVYLQPFLIKYSNGNLIKFKLKISNLEKSTTKYSDFNSWLILDLESFTSDDSLIVPKYLNVSTYFVKSPINSIYANWLNSDLELNLINFNFYSNAYPEQIFRFLINYWKFDFFSNKFYPTSEYFNLDEFNIFKIHKNIFTTLMGKKYFVSNTLNSENTLDFKTIFKIAYY